MAKKKQLTLEEKLEEAIVKDGPYEVPRNWVWSKLGEVCNKVQYGYTEKASTEKVGPHFLRITDIQENGVDWNLVPYCPILEKDYDKYKLDKGDIVIARTGATTGKNYIINDEVDSVFASYLIRIKINRKIYNKFISYYMYSNLYWNQIMEEQKGIAQPGVNAQKLSALIVPLSPLKEQKRIVDRIESFFEKLDKAKKLIEEAREGFEKRKSAVLEKAFRGELTEKWRIENNVPFQWNKCKFKDFILSIQAGKNFKCTERPANINEVGLIKISAVTWGEFNQFENKVVEDKDKINENYFIKKGDYLISRANTLELVGSSVIVKSIDQRLMLSDKVWRVEFNNEIVCKELINYYVKSIKGREEIENRATGNQLSMRNISQDSFKDINIELPEVREQLEIVRILYKLFCEEDKIRELTQLEDEIELIKKSILAKAFRGDLGTNSEEDESALELLKEILSKDI